jgi:hypothetical protein
VTTGEASGAFVIAEPCNDNTDREMVLEAVLAGPDLIAEDDREALETDFESFKLVVCTGLLTLDEKERIDWRAFTGRRFCTMVNEKEESTGC